MKRLVYDGSVNQGDTTLYVFISNNLEDAEDIFYDLYEEDIWVVAEEYMTSEEDTVYGLTINLEVDNKTKKVKYKTISIGIESEDEELCEYEINDIELDDKMVKVLLEKIG